TREIAGLHDRQACTREQAARAGRVLDIAQYDPISATPEKRGDQLLLALQHVAAVADQRLEAARTQHFGEAGDRRSVDRSGDGGDEKSNQTRAPAGQAARAQIRDITRRGHSSSYALASLRRNFVRLAQRARDSDGRELRHARHVDEPRGTYRGDGSRGGAD